MVAAPTSRTIPALLAEAVARHGELPAIVDGDRRLDYAVLQAEARQLARALLALGVRRGDRVGLWMGNRAEWLLLAFAIQGLGATLVCVNTWWKQAELRFALEVAQVSVLIMEDEFAGQDYVAILGRLAPLEDSLPALRHVVALGRRRAEGAIAWERFAAGADRVAGAAVLAAEAAVAPTDTALICFTSGSTARPKAAPLQHWGLIENPWSIGERMKLQPGDGVFVPVTLFWSFGCANALFATVTHGGHMVLQRRFDAAEALDILEREGCAAAYILPNMALALAAEQRRRPRRLTAWRTGLTLPQGVGVLAGIGVSQICAVYGLTEAYGNSAVTPCDLPLERRLNACGPPLPGTEMQMVDPETRRVLPPGAVGEVRVRGYAIAEYVDDPENSAAAIDTAGWFHTGDLGRFDEHGHFVFHGRIKEMIRSGGINISPAEVERALETHPDIAQAVVVGIPDPAKEEVPAALIVPRAPAALSAGEVADFCRRNMARYKLPAMIRLVARDAVPLTDTGKVNKRAVQAMLTREAGG